MKIVNTKKATAKTLKFGLSIVSDETYETFDNETKNLSQKQLKKWKSYIHNEDGSKNKVVYDLEEKAFTSYNHILKQPQYIVNISSFNHQKQDIIDRCVIVGQATEEMVLSGADDTKFQNIVSMNSTNNHYRNKHIKVPNSKSGAY
jgi:hypothetical protein